MSGTVAGRLLALLGIYLLTLGSLAWGDLAIGLVLAASMELGWRHRLSRGGWIGSDTDDGPERPALHRALLAVPRLILATVGEITRGTWEVSKYSLGFREVACDGFVEIETKGISEEGIATLAFIVTISPGEIVVEIDGERGVMVIHALDIRDPAAIRRHHREFYERYQRKVVP